MVDVKIGPEIRRRVLSRAASARSLTPSAALRAELARGLRDLDFPRWERLGESLAGDPSWKVRAETALSVALSPGPPDAALLTKLAGDGTWQVRRSAAVAIGEAPTAETLPVLLRLLADAHEEVRRAALRAWLRVRTLEPGGALSAQRTGGRPPLDSSKISLGETPGLRSVREVAERADRFEVAAARGGGPPLPQAAGAEPPAAPVQRYVNSWFTGHGDVDEPLAYGHEYRLNLQVSPRLQAGSHTQHGLEFQEPGASEPSIDVVVAVVSDDFEVLGPPARRMRLPTDTRENSPVVHFRVRPRKNNQDLHLHVLFYAGNAMFHEVVVGARAQVGARPPAGEESAVYTGEEVYRRPPAKGVDANLQVVPAGDGYRIVFFADDGSPTPQFAACHTTLTRSQVAELLISLRDGVLDALDFESDDGREFYDAEPQDQARAAGRLAIPRVVSDACCRRAVEKLIAVGRRVESNLFDSVRDDRRTALALHKRLKEVSGAHNLRLQILSDHFFVPWNLLYDDAPGEPDAERFWGFRHRIEELPYRVQHPAEETLSLGVDDELAVGLNLNRAVLKDVLIDPQVARVGELLRGRTVRERSVEAEVLAMLSGEEPCGRLEYFYCHAGTGGEVDDRYEQSYLGLTGADEGLTLEQIKLGSFGHSFDQRPVFILNACESAQMDGRFYDGFVPRLLSTGAAAVVGTECKVPEVLAAHLGLDLMEALLGGRPLGEALLEARRDFLRRYRNPFGLLYRSFGSADLRFDRA